MEENNKKVSVKISKIWWIIGILVVIVIVANVYVITNNKNQTSDDKNFNAEKQANAVSTRIEKVDEEKKEEKKEADKPQNSNNSIKYEISTKNNDNGEPVYAIIKATKDGKTYTKEFDTEDLIDKTGTMELPGIGSVALVARTGGEYYGITVYQLVNEKIEIIGNIDCGADMVEEATYDVATQGKTTAVITANRNGEKTKKEVEMNAEIANTKVIDVLNCGKVVLVAETGGEYYALKVFRLSQDYTTGKTKDIIEVGQIQLVGLDEAETDNQSDKIDYKLGRIENTENYKEITKELDEDYLFELESAIKNDNGTYTLYGKIITVDTSKEQIAEFPFYKETGEYKKITLSSDAKYKGEYYNEEEGYLDEINDTVENVFSKKLNEKDGVNIAYTFEFNNGKCVSIEEVETGH